MVCSFSDISILDMFYKLVRRLLQCFKGEACLEKKGSILLLLRSSNILINYLLISLLGHEILPDISLASCIALTIDSLKYSIQVNIPFMQLIVMCLLITGYIFNIH